MSDGNHCSFGYTWSQTQDRVIIVFELPSSVKLIDVDVTITAKEIKGGVIGKNWHIAGILQHEVLPSSTWALESNSVVRVILDKTVHVAWTYPIKADCVDGTPMDAQSELELAVFYNNNSDYQTALVHLTAATEKGNMEGRVMLGKLYSMGVESGYPLNKNMVEAINHYRIAAENHSGEAQFLLGTLYMEGDPSLTADSKQAAEWYKKCVGANIHLLERTRGPYLFVITALFNLGLIYQNGKGNVPVNYPEAIEWWQKAAKFNFAPALFNLGIMYVNGSGVAKDEQIADEFFQKAKSLNPNLVYARPSISSSPATCLSPQRPNNRVNSVGNNRIPQNADHDGTRASNDTVPSPSHVYGRGFAILTIVTLGAGLAAFYFLRKKK